MCACSSLSPAGPRLLSSSYDIRFLKVGSVELSGSVDSSVSDVAAGYQLSWNRYQILNIELVFDQPLYISSQHAIEGTHTRTSSTPRSSSSSTFGSANLTVAPHDLVGSISLECRNSKSHIARFELSAWREGNTTDRESFWSKPRPDLLPTFSHDNMWKEQLEQLFDPEVEATTRKPTTLFGSSSSSSASLLKVAGSPNVLSLMLVSSFADESGRTTFLDLDTDQPNPAAGCNIRYHSVAARIEAAAAAASSSSSADVAAGGDSSRLSGLTNFRGHEVSFPATPITVKTGRATPTTTTTERIIYRVQQGLEQTLDLEDEEDAASGDAPAAPPSEDRLYAHSPLDDAPPVAAVVGSPSVVSPAHASLALDALDDPFHNVFLDVSAASQFVSLILRPICHGVMKPATKGTNDLLLDDLMTEFGLNMFDSVVDEVGPDLNIMLGLSVEGAVSNVLQDSLTYAITKSLAQAITANVSPYVVDRLIKNIPGPLHTIIQSILEKKIPDRLERTMPVILSRVLSVTLTHSLTRSIPHIVVPAVSHSLGLGHAGSFSRPKAYYEVCMKCYMQSVGIATPVRMSPPDLNPDGYDSGIGSGGQKAGSECGACPTSTYSMYYGIYHAAYYTDFYSSETKTANTKEMRTVRVCQECD